MCQLNEVLCPACKARFGPIDDCPECGGHGYVLDPWADVDEEIPYSLTENQPDNDGPIGEQVGTLFLARSRIL